MRQENLRLVRRLNGRKRLIRGNHDIFSTQVYVEAGFEEIYGVRVFTPREVGAFFCATHVPVHTSALERWAVNVHGHTHSNRVTLPNHAVDPRYCCVCMEQLDDYKPVHVDEIISYIKSGEFGEGSY